MKIVLKIFVPVSILVFTCSIGSCKKLIEVDAPVTSTNAENVYTTNATAAAVLTGIYSQISNSDFEFNFPTNITGICAFTGLSADELTLFGISNSNYFPFYKNDLSPLTSTGVFWKSIYPVIFIANSAIEGLSASTSLTPSVKQQLLGEAKFIRAFLYFYLVNLYGEIPLALTSDWKSNSLLPRSNTSLVYEQIINDLIEAQNLLNPQYLKSDALGTYPDILSSERVRPTKWAATALLARIYLYTKDWSNAEAQSSIVINNTDFYGLPVLPDVFLKNSMETIWSLQPVNNGTKSNTGAGALFILPATGPDDNEYPVYLSNTLVNSFEQGDLRVVNWIDSVKPDITAFYYPKKYKIGKIDNSTQEYVMMLRFAEQLLIRAEARAQLNNFDGARADLDLIRNRAGLAPATANDLPSLLDAIQQERRHELFTEWGDRWFNLKRTETIDQTMLSVAPQKDASWDSYKSLYPIPNDEIANDLNLVQNPGY